jgi:ABC-type bacteriocin/lantibiotic exporter with double-glycine peptidase domain
VSPDGAAQTLIDRFPHLARLRANRRRRIPVVRQLTTTECGAACLAMVLSYHGRSVSLADVRAAMGPGRDGTSALELLEAAQRFGLSGRGVRLEIDDLALLPSGSILHWGFNHFVVLERASRNRCDIVDPRVGRRRVGRQELTREFTGVAVVLEPSPLFSRAERRGRPVAARLRGLVFASGAWPRILVVSALLQVFALALPLLTGAVVDLVVPRGDVHLLVVLSAGLAGLIGAHFVASMIRAHLLIQLRTVFDSRMTLGFLDHLLQLPYAFFQQRSAGDLMMRLNSSALVRELLTSGALSTLLDGTLVAGYVLVIFAIDRSFAALVLTLAAAQLVVLWSTRRRQRELMGDALQTQARADSYLVEMLAGMETLKASGNEARSGQLWSSLFVDQLNVALSRWRLGAIVDSLTSTLRLASPLVILTFGAIKTLHGELTLGAALSLCALAGAFLTPLSNLVTTLGQLQLLGSYVDRIEDVLASEPEQSADRPVITHYARGRIALQSVSFRYNPHGPLVVQDVSLEVTPGQCLAIVGRSGSGKSTLGSLLLGLHAPTSGRVSYDGVDLAGVELRSLRRQLGVVDQRAYLFGTTIRANITGGDPAVPLEDVIEAARVAQIDDEVRAMPMGYETILLGGGASLSGGQRQRIALARALVRHPLILLLDEATSALDARTELAVQEQLTRLSCTRVVIAHRLSTIRTADKIIVMDAGRIVEHGTHDELLRRAGAYASLVAAQVEGPQ